MFFKHIFECQHQQPHLQNKVLTFFPFAQQKNILNAARIQIITLHISLLQVPTK